MRKRISRITSVLSILCCGWAGQLVLIGCSGDTTNTHRSNRDYFPESIESQQVARTGDIRMFEGEELWEYINGDAELYHQYGFVEVATADYKGEQFEATADIYIFEDELGAYGLFTSIRPQDPQLLQLGVQGFSSGLSVGFVKGPYVVRITPFTTTGTTLQTIGELARELERAIPGTTERPPGFDLFPTQSTVPYSDKFQRESFMGQVFLTDFYSHDYIDGTDTVMLFYTEEDASEKFRQWQEQAASQTEHSIKEFGLPFDENQVIVTDSYRGAVVAGLAGDRLAGMVNFSPGRVELLVSWLKTFTPADR